MSAAVQALCQFAACNKPRYGDGEICADFSATAEISAFIHGVLNATLSFAGTSKAQSRGCLKSQGPLHLSRPVRPLIVQRLF
jgi:hypothetical protein